MDVAVPAKNEGVTAAERHLSRLSNRSFLRLWSYTGVARDQTNGQGKSQGKEVCDLLVLFGEHVCIFSDKDCAFQENKPIEVAWARWLRHAILESAEQVFGAERWIRTHPHRLYTDLSCKTKLPLTLPDPTKMKIHRIIVAHGSASACRNFFKSGSGSLVVSNRLEGEEAHKAEPFKVGQPYPDKGFVHIFDDVTLDIVLKTLDTIRDFTDYLDRRQAFLSGLVSVTAAGEEELLANYLGSLNAEGQHDFTVPPAYNSVIYDEGHWKAFNRSPQRARQILANRGSYSWDALIEVFTTHTLNGTHRTTTQKSIAEQEFLYKWLAREPRTRRRMLANALLGIVVHTPDGMHAARVIEPSYPGDPYFVFVVAPKSDIFTEEQYRTFRQEYLRLYCEALKVKYPKVLDVVGIATESGLSGARRSEDLIYMDMRTWTQEMAEASRELREKLGLLTHEARRESREYEYPRADQPLSVALRPVVISRNKKCPCKSGMRYGKCHGKAFYDRQQKSM
jgi:hypothetical protein